MLPIVIQDADIKYRHEVSRSRARIFIEIMPDDFTCHQVCEELVKKLPAWRHVRGYFASRGWDHSWLKHETDDVILDPYPWCCASGPILIYIGGTLNPWRSLYIEESAEQRASDREISPFFSFLGGVNVQASDV